MNMRPHHTIAVFCAFGITIAGCASLHTQNSSAKAESVSASTVDQAMALLNEGQPEQARALLVNMVSKTTPHPTASVLLAEIDKDPETLLGQTFERYEVRPGDTMSDLAARFAGDSRLFYALSRRNSLKAPNKLRAGAIIDVPAKRAVPIKPPALEPAATSAEEAATPTSMESRGQPSPAEITSPADVSNSVELRRTALQRLNEGDVDLAVSLLQEARRLAPKNDAISADLARAERIQETLKKRATEAPKTLH